MDYHIQQKGIELNTYKVFKNQEFFFKDKK